jgi:DegV family protein with EDD domain
MNVRVVTDSACDLPEAVASELGIEIVPLSIRFGEEEFVDRRDLTPSQFWAKVAASPVLPQTAAPSAGAFEEVFRKLVDDGAGGIVCINLSGHLSATLQAAEIAAKSLEGVCPVEIIDSQSVTLALGNLCIAAARRAAAGASLADVVAYTNELRGRTRLYGALDTLENLKKGGRVGGAQAMIGSMLSIKPIVHLENGEVEPTGRVRTRSKALRFLVDKVKEEGNVENLGVLHGAAPDVDELLDMLDPLYARNDIVVADVGPVIGTHAGPGVVGVTYHVAR